MKPLNKLILSLVLFAISVSNPFSVKAQKIVEKFTARNGLYLEAGGSSGRYAVNYSRIIHQKGKLKFNASVGFSMWRSSIDFKSYTSTKWLPALPMEFTGFYGRGNHHLELGFGLISYLDQGIDPDPNTFKLDENMVFGANISTRIGYRYQKPEGGLFFRVGYTPFFAVPVGRRGEWSFQPYFAGVSIGKSF